VKLHNNTRTTGEVPSPASISTHAPLPLDRVSDVKFVDDSVRSPDEEQEMAEPAASVADENEEPLTDNDSLDELAISDPGSVVPADCNVIDDRVAVLVALRLIMGVPLNEIGDRDENTDTVSDPVSTRMSENDTEATFS
jgi:predicted  nucleic acid-binding Zn-ribbon protein